MTEEDVWGPPHFGQHDGCLQCEELGLIGWPKPKKTLEETSEELMEALMQQAKDGGLICPECGNLYSNAPLNGRLGKREHYRLGG